MRANHPQLSDPWNASPLYPEHFDHEDAEQTVACWRSIQDDVARERRIAAARHSAG